MSIKKSLLSILVAIIFVTTAFIATQPVFAQAIITVNNNDGPGEGFNDPAPFIAVGGNPALTIGEARLIAFQHAAFIWGSCLNSSVEIQIDAEFNPLTCTPTSAVLGSAGANTVHRDFFNAPIANTWYPQALANAIATIDLDPAQADISAQFETNA